MIQKATSTMDYLTDTDRFLSWATAMSLPRQTVGGQAAMFAAIPLPQAVVQSQLPLSAGEVAHFLPVDSSYLLLKNRLC